MRKRFQYDNLHNMLSNIKDDILTVYNVEKQQYFYRPLTIREQTELEKIVKNRR